MGNKSYWLPKTLVPTCKDFLFFILFSQGNRPTQPIFLYSNFIKSKVLGNSILSDLSLWVYMFIYHLAVKNYFKYLLKTEYKWYLIKINCIMYNRWTRWSNSSPKRQSLSRVALWELVTCSFRPSTVIHTVRLREIRLSIILQIVATTEFIGFIYYTLNDWTLVDWIQVLWSFMRVCFKFIEIKNFNSQ